MDGHPSAARRRTEPRLQAGSPPTTCGRVLFRITRSDTEEWRSGHSVWVGVGDGPDRSGWSTSAPSRDVIDRVLASLESSSVGGGATGAGIGDAAILIVCRGSDQPYYGGWAGIWTVDQRLVGYIGPSDYTHHAAGQLTDPDGRLLSERRVRPRKPRGRLIPISRAEPVVTNGHRILAKLRSSWRAITIEPPPPAKPWLCRCQRGTWSV